MLLSASFGHRERIYSKSVQDQSVKTEGVVNGALYGLGLSAIQWSAPAFYTASRNFQGRQHSRGQDGGDQFAVGHFGSPLIDETVNTDRMGVLLATPRVKLVAISHRPGAYLC